MKKHFSFFISILITTLVFAQNNYEKGYLINQEGQRIDCLIKNDDWKNNPTSFKYKLSESGAQQKGKIETVQEFAITGHAKYKRSTVQLDRSSSQFNSLTSTKNPIYKKETVFLKALVEGPANLYMFEATNVNQYFYSLADGEMVPLVYKEYLSPTNKILTNHKYKSQLFSALNCNNEAAALIKKISFNREDLLKYFTRYNSCQGVTSSYVNKAKKLSFGLSIRPGISAGSITLTNPGFLASITSTTDYGNVSPFRVGIEAEIFFSFNNRRLSIIAEPTLSLLSTEKEVEDYGLITIKMNTFEIPFGVRYYFPISSKGKLYLNAGINLNLGGETLLNYEKRIFTEFKSKVNQSVFAGLGFKHQSGFSVEVRYQPERDGLIQYPAQNALYSGIDFIVGYTFFK